MLYIYVRKKTVLCITSLLDTDSSSVKIKKKEYQLWYQLKSYHREINNKKSTKLTYQDSNQDYSAPLGASGTNY